MNIWLLTNAPTPYQEELFAALAKISDVTLHVRYMRGSNRERLRHATVEPSPFVRVIRGLGPQGWPDEVRLHPRAVWECLFGDYDGYVLSGLWTSVTLIACTVLLRVRHRQSVLWLERPHSDKIRAAGVGKLRWRAPLRGLCERVRRTVVAGADAVLCVGTSAREAYAALGAVEESLFVLPYCCDTARFRAFSQQSVYALRERLSIKGKTVLLFSGQMIPRKGVDILIRIFERVAMLRPNVALLLLGDGPHRREYEAMVPGELRARVHFAGFVPQPELPTYFAAADVFVFPSRHDGWGVVINEACAAGLPVVASQQTGAARDLVEDGMSGFVLDAEDIDGFVDRLLLLIDGPALRLEYGARSRELVAPFSAVNGAALFAEYLRHISGGDKSEAAARRPGHVA